VSEEAAREVAKAVRQVLCRYRQSGAREELSRYQENSLQMELQAKLDEFRYTNAALADFYFALIPMPVPRENLPSPEERAARILMGLDPYPAAFACRLGLKFVQINGPGPTAGFGYSLGMDMSTSEYTVLVTSENDSETIAPT